MNAQLLALNPFRIAATACVLFAVAGPVTASMLRQDRNQSRLLVRVAIEDGRLVVDRQNSEFLPSALFRQKSRLYQQLRRQLNASQADVELIRRVKSDLSDDLDRCLAMTPKLYWWMLSREDRALDAEGRLKDERTTSVRTFSGSYKDFKAAVERWMRARTGQFNNEYAIAFERTLSQLSLDPIAIETKTALIYNSTDDDGFPTYDAGPGSVSFQVADPVDGSDFQISIKGSGCGAKLIANQGQIVSLLKPLAGGLWRSAEIRSVLEDFYASLGYEATVVLSEAREANKIIQIEESPRIARIVFACSGSNLCESEKSLEEALYLLLPHSAFRRFIKRGRFVGGEPAVSAAFKPLDLSGLLPASAKNACPEPYVNLFKLQGQQMALSQIGMVVGQAVNVSRSAGEVTYIDLQVQKMTDSGAAGSKTPESVIEHPTPTAGPEGLINASHQTFEKQPLLTPVPQLERHSDATAATADSAGWEPKERKNYLGGGFEYRPGQGVRTFAIYQRSRLFTGTDDFSIKFGGQSGVLGGVNYFADYLFFGSLHRRLSIRLSAGSDLVSSRVLGGVTVDERRTGGAARVELELFRDLNGHQLRFFAEGERKTVELDDGEIAPAHLNLTTFDGGADYYYQSDHSRHPITIRLQPRLRLGLGAAADEPRFGIFSVRGSYHQKLPRLYELDFNGQLVTDSRSTPLFEQASLGGSDVVRGFRQDDAVGRRMWSLQSEVWAPFPWIAGGEDRLASYIRRNTRLALFLDVGGIYRTSFSEPGTRIGPGLGVRIIKSPIIIKLDWAYGIGRGVTGSGRGRFYVSVATTLPF